MICNKCNHKLPDDSEFCQYCGNKIAENHFDDVENMSNREALNLIVPTQKVATKERHGANSQSRSNSEVDANFDIQKVQTVKKSQVESSKFDIINILAFLLPIILSAVRTCSSTADDIFAFILIIGIITIILKMVAVVNFTNNIIFSSVISCGLLIMMIGSLASGDEELAPWVCLFTLYLFVCELCKLIRIGIEKYHGTQNYKMRCYKKINLINAYREKGVITQAEFEETRNQIISKIQ